MNSRFLCALLILLSIHVGGKCGCLAFHPVAVPIGRVRPHRRVSTLRSGISERRPRQQRNAGPTLALLASRDHENTGVSLQISEKGAFGDDDDFVSSTTCLVNRADRLLRADDEELLLSQPPEEVIVNGLPTDEVANRRRFMGSSLLATGVAIGVGSMNNGGVAIGEAAAAAADFDVGFSTFASSSTVVSTLQWEKSPINKRSGVTLKDAEKNGFNVRFVTYLSRFLLSFDEDCQRWWYTRAGDIPRTATAEKVGELRLSQFAAFSASVEVGLLEYSGPDGPRRLMASLLQRYCPTLDELKLAREARGEPPLTSAAEAKQQREINEARRQIALLFGLMQTYQPVEEITKLLAGVDNATITSVVVTDPGSGYAPGYGSPFVAFPPPPGEGYETATGRAILRPSGQLLRLDLVDRGSGYVKPPPVTIAAPAAAADSNSNRTGNPTAATATAFIFREGPNKGKLERIQLVSPGSGYSEGESIEITIPPPAAAGGVQATANAVLELEVGAVEIVSGGSGYAAEKPLQVFVEPPPLTARVDMNDPMQAGLISPDQPLPPTTIPSAAMRAKMPSPDDPSSRRFRALQDAINSGKGGGGGCIGRACYDRSVVATAYPRAAINSYASFRKDGDAANLVKEVENAVLERRRSASSSAKRKASNQVSGTSSGEESGLPSLPYWGGGASSSPQLLGLLPSGVGLVYDNRLRRYTLARGQEDVTRFMPGSTKPLDPEFGPRGRSPIERDPQLDGPTFLRFCLSGAICCSGAHLLLTPIDVVKTKVQTDPVKYPDVLSALKTVSSEDGAPGVFFTGWVPTFLGFFVNGGTSYSVTEFFRRYFTEQAGSSALSLEVPIILASASIAAFGGCFTLAPFETVRIRSVAQPDYADNIVGVFNRLVKEEGIASFFSAVPAFIPKEILFASAKFTVFDLSTDYMYDAFPAAREDLRLSLLVSLVGGTLGGVAAAIVSNPADATISEMKKAKTDIGPFGAFKALLERGGIPLLFRGLGLRMFFYSLIVSIQFLVYDAVRYSLRIGSDDLKLYLDVLGGALSDTGGPV